MQSRIILLYIGIAFSISGDLSAQVSPLHPTISHTISKRDNRICAGFGTSVIEFDASKVNDFKSIDVSGEVLNIFPIASAEWGIISKNGIYRWAPSANILEQQYSDDSQFLMGAYHQGKVYLAKNDTIYTLSESGNLLTAGKIFGDIKNFGFINDDLLVFGNGSWVITLGTSTPHATKVFEEFWASDGIVNPSSGEFAVGGGGWPGVIVKWANPRTIKMIVRKKHSTYDTIAGWDVTPNGEYWLTAKLAGEAAIDDGQNLFQSYPSQAIVYPPPVIFNDFVVDSGKIFLSTYHGIVIINLQSGAVSLLARAPAVKPFFELVKANLNLKAHLTASFKEAENTWLGGELIGGHWNKASFILLTSTNGFEYYNTPIKGLRQILRHNNQLLISGQAIDTWEGGGREESGGLATFDISTHETKIIFPEPITHMRIEDNKAHLESYVSVGDLESNCYQDKTIIYDLLAWKEISSTSTIVCEEGRERHDTNEGFTLNTARVEEISKLVQSVQYPANIDIEMPSDLAIEKPVVLQLRVTARIEQEEITTTPTTFENPRAPQKKE